MVKQYIITVKSSDDEVSYECKKPVFLKVKTGDVIEVGTQLTEGSINPTDYLRIKGLKALQEYLLSEVIYRANDIFIDFEYHSNCRTRNTWYCSAYTDTHAC